MVYYLVYIWILPKLHIKRMQKCHFCTSDHSLCIILYLLVYGLFEDSLDVLKYLQSFKLILFYSHHCLKKHCWKNTLTNQPISEKGQQNKMADFPPPLEEDRTRVSEKDETTKGSETEVGFGEETVVTVHAFSSTCLLFCDVLWWYIMYDSYVWDIKSYVRGIIS